MSTAFVDSSGLVKRYLQEAGTELVAALEQVDVAEIARVEVVGAFWRRYRDGGLTPDAARALTADFESDWFGDTVTGPQFGIVRSDGVLLDRAAELVARHPLRAADAIQLASASAARDADPELTTMVCFDDRLRVAAAIEGFALLP